MYPIATVEPVELFVADPTAMHVVVDVHDTLARSPLSPDGGASGCGVHVEPNSVITSGSVLDAVCTEPTTTQDVGDRHDIEEKDAPDCEIVSIA